MKIHRLQLQAFRSFIGKQELIFPDDAGFYFVTGKNEIEPDLEGNGAGKSSFFVDGITWILYGKTSRKQVAGNVNSWAGGKTTTGELEFTVNNSRHTLFRTWNPNSLKILEGDSKKDITQEELEQIIGLSFDPFLHSVLFGQFRPFFFDLEPAAKSALLSSILDLSEWDAYSKTASVRETELTLWLQDTKQALVDVLARIETLKDISYEEKIKSWEEQKLVKQEELQGKQTKAAAELHQIKDKADVAVAAKQKAEASLNEYNEYERDLLSLKRDAEKEVTDTTIESRVLTVKITELKRVREELENQVNAVCTACGQRITEGHIEKEVEKVAKQLSALQLKTATQRQAVDQANGVKAEVQAELEAFWKETNALKVETANCTMLVNQLKSRSAELLSDLRLYRLQLTELEQAKNPYVLEQSQTKAKIQELERQEEKYLSELEESNKKINAVGYWTKAFRSVRLYLLSEILTQLELEVNNSLFQLGLRDWKIEFALDKETKKGTVQKGFNVMIYSPNHNEPIPWESWSGGETQRLRLAGALGLSNLILARNGIAPFMEVFDEPSQFLSERGITDMLELLDTRAKTQQRQIWLIDHRNLDSVQFDGVYEVVKTSDGSQVRRI